MIQYKEKAAGQRSVRAALLSYPVLQAADILLYGVESVPVGEDQRQHLELARDLAIRFNRGYGDTFTVPRAVTPPVAARVMDLRDPAVKMSKSAPPAAPGVIRLLDPPEVVRHKIARAVTDSGGEVVYDPAGKPGVANLLTILAACTGTTPAAAAAGLGSYRDLKEAAAEAVSALTAPVRRRYASLAANPAAVLAVIRRGAEMAQELAAPTLARAQAAIGLLPRPASDPAWAGAAWNRLLSKIGVAGGTAAEETTFYTALYHSLLDPASTAMRTASTWGSIQGAHRPERACGVHELLGLGHLSLGGAAAGPAGTGSDQ